MTFHWFGDSWVYGDELENRTLAYPYLVSNYFEAGCQIHAEKASGVSHLVWQTKNANIQPGDTVFYGLSGLDRTFAFASDGCIHHLTEGMQLYPQWVKNAETLNLVQTWYKNFDNQYTRHYASANALDLCKAFALQNKATAYFYNIFSINKIDTEIVQPEDWLINPLHCLGEEILHLLDNEFYTIILKDQPYLLEKEWKMQKNMLEKYFYPNGNHPNELGHITLSKRLINEIASR